MVTGGASGMVKATVLVFAREGAKAVVVSDINAKDGEEVAELVRKSGLKCYCQTVVLTGKIRFLDE